MSWVVPLSVNCMTDILQVTKYIHPKAQYYSITIIPPEKLVRDFYIRDEKNIETYKSCKTLVDQFNKLGYITDIQYVELGECVITIPKKI